MNPKKKLKASKLKKPKKIRIRKNPSGTMRTYTAKSIKTNKDKLIKIRKTLQDPDTCICSIDTLIYKGCRCGAIEKERSN